MRGSSTSPGTRAPGPGYRPRAGAASPRSSPASAWPRTPSPSTSRRSGRRPRTQRWPPRRHWWPGSSSCSAATNSATRCSSTASVLRLPGATPDERRAAARAHVPPAVLELFEVRLPALAAELAAGRAGLGEGVGLYHMVLEGIVFDAGQRALLDDLADGALPGVREGTRRIELDERWHIGFGLRCLIEAQPSPDLLDDLLARAEDAAAAWGDAVPAATRERAAHKCARRLSVVHLINAHAAA